MSLQRKGQEIYADEASNWSGVNPILPDGVIGIDLTYNRMKLGDGTTAWTSLTYTDEMLDGLAVSVAGATNGYVLVKTASGIETINLEGILVQHGSLQGLEDDNHPQYVRHDIAIGSDEILVSDVVGHFARMTVDDFITTYSIGTGSGSVDPADLVDYSLIDGTRAYTGHVKAPASEPTHLQQLTPWTWVQRVGYNTPWRKPCRVATTGNIDISSPPETIDGITLVTGDRVLVWQQTDATENGIYEVTIS